MLLWQQDAHSYSETRKDTWNDALKLSYDYKTVSGSDRHNQVGQNNQRSGENPSGSRNIEEV